MSKALFAVIAAVVAVAGLAVAGNAGSQEQPQAPGAGAVPDPAAQDSPVGPLETMQAQATPTSSLAAPEKLLCSADSTSISLSWKAVPGADEYQVLMSGIPWAVTTGTSYQLGGLPGNTRFELGVQAGGDDGWGAPTAKICATEAEGGIWGASEHSKSTASDIPSIQRIPICSTSTDTSITITWEAVPDIGVTGYKVTASLPVNSYTGSLVGTTKVSGRTTTSAEITGLKPFTTYIMGVRAIKGGQEGVGTGRSCVTKAAAPECGSATSRSIKITWEKNVTESSISVYQWYAARKKTKEPSAPYTGGRAVSGTRKSMVLTGLAPETKYTFSLSWRAFRNGTLYPAHDTVDCWTKPIPIPPRVIRPVAPTSLGCAATTTTITLSWAKPARATRYQVSRAASGATWVGTTGTSHKFTALDPDTSYTLIVRAGNSAGWSANASKTCSTLPLPLPPAPSGLQCTATATTVTASWDAADASHSVDDYQISKDGGTKWENPAGAATTHTFAGLAPDTAHSISVRAHNTTGWGPKADKTCRTAKIDPSPPTCGAATSTSVTLEWAAEEGVSAWLAARATTGDRYTDGRKLDASAGSTVFTGLTPGLSYTFLFWWRVAEDADWVKVAPSAVCSTERLPAPTGIGCEASDTAVAVFWDKVAGATGYQVSMTDYPWFTPKGALSHTFTGLTPDTSYGFRVRAGATAGGRTGWGEQASVECSTRDAPLGAPTGLACATSLVGASLSWTEVDGATKYRVSLDGGATWAASDELSSHAAAGLDPAAAHNAQVQAGNAAAWGGTASAVCPVVVVPAPAELVCATTLSSITLSWEAIEGVKSYTATLKSSSAPAADILQTKTATSASAAFTGLAAGEKYYLSAQANHAGLSTGTAEIWCSANTAPPVCAAVGANFAVVSWQADDIVHQWRVAMAVGPDSFSRTAVLASDELSASFYGLSAETDYTFHLWWRPSAQSPWTQVHPPATCTTAEPPLPAPIGAVCTAAVNSLTLRWNPVAGATRYRVAENEEKNWKEATRSTAFTLTGLAADSLYDSIHLQTGDANSWDRIVSFSCKTLPATALAAPGGLQCTASAGAITLRWNPVAGATRYRAGHGHTWTALGTARQHTFGGLQADTSYDLRVQAGDADGWESVAAVKPCSTAAAALQAPVLRCTAATPSSVTWGWAPVPGATGYQHRTTGTGAWQTTTTPDLSNPSITIATAPRTSHRLRVQATGTGGTSPETVHECGAAPGGGRPAHPEAPLPACAAATTASITVEWPPAFAATSYKVGHSANNYSLQTHTGAELSATITGLSPNQESTVLVRSVNSTGATLGVVICRTLAEAPKNPAVTCTANQEGPPTINIAWDATPGAENYQATLTREETPLGGPPQTALIARYTGNQANIIADGDHNTAYQVKSRARTAAGWTDWTAAATVRCPAPT